MFEIWQCSNEACRFRFPAERDNGRFPQSSSCPRCGAPLTRVPAQFALAEEETAVSSPNSPHLSALLDNIRSIHNVGSMFRTADGAGLAHLYLCGMTATPEHPKIAKAALGAQHTVSWSQHNNGLETAVALKQKGYALWAIEATPNARPLFATPHEFAQPTVLIVGNEKAGVDPHILDQCDRVFSLPMHGHKRSLNAAVAFGIAVYYLQFAKNLGEINDSKRAYFSPTGSNT